MCEDEINIGVTEIVNTILVEAQPNDQIIDINVSDNTEDVTINCTPNLIEVNINTGVGDKSVVVVDTIDDLPLLGETETLYLALDTKFLYIWDNVNEEYTLITDYIPYLGAIKNANLGEYGLKAGWLGLDTTPTNTPTTEGTISWNSTDGTADLKLKGGNVTLQVGQEEVVRVVNKTGETLNEADFRAVRIRSVAEGGAQGQRLAVVLAQANNDANSATTIGLVTESILNNQEGFITTFGNVSGINTTGAKSFGGSETWVDGDMLYLSPTNAGYLTNVKPSAPNHMVVIGYVVYAHANNGKIFVKVDNGYELDELHNVQITSPTNNQGLIYDSALSVWKNASIQMNLSATSPLSIASSVLSITKADATTDGYLSSTDWNYFSSKQQPLSGTGFIKATGSVISYDNTAYTPQSRTLTINGTAYDLSADRSWSISVGSGMRNVSSFVATSGQTSFTIVGGYTAGLVDVFVNGARLNAGDYTATNGTTIVLGNGLVANDIVDIINYTASITSGITGSGTTNYLPLWSGSSNLTNSLISQSGTTITANGVFKANGVIASIDGGLYAGSGYQLVFADYGSSEYAAIEGSSFSGALSYLRFITNANEKMRLTATGYLGIGTTTPRASIETTGYIYSGGNWIPNDNTGAAFYIGDLATGSSYTYISGKGTSSTDTYLSLSTNNLERVRVIANGNVGIGLINPAYKVDVVGDINITGTFRVNGTPFSGGGTTLNGTGFVKASGTTISYDNSTYVPTNGTGATGTWGISISGTSANTSSISSAVGSNYTWSGTQYFQSNLGGYSGSLSNAPLQAYSTGNNSAFMSFHKGGVYAVNMGLDADNVFRIGGWSALSNRLQLEMNGNLTLAGDVRTTGLRLNTNTSANQGHRIYSRTMDIASYNTASMIRFSVAGGNSIQFHCESLLHLSRLSGNLAETRNMRYSSSITIHPNGSPEERWFDITEARGNGIGNFGRSNQTGYFDLQSSAFDTANRATLIVQVTCSNWDAVTVTFP